MKLLVNFRPYGAQMNAVYATKKTSSVWTNNSTTYSDEKLDSFHAAVNSIIHFPVTVRAIFWQFILKSYKNRRVNDRWSNMRFYASIHGLSSMEHTLNRLAKYNIV